VDGVVISDYGKGAITYEVVEAIARLNVPTFIDSKRDPRFFDIVMHPYFFPNQKEYLQYVNEYALQPDVIRKKGPEGIAHEQFGKTQWSLPAWATRVVSVCGAGDTVIAAYAYRFFGSVDKLEPLEYANAAAAVVVGKPYTAVASPEEIKAIMTGEIHNPDWSAM
jgi:D-beta-D-heptose 7-phosphate kinase/D-beta-D-heptose 1-phosphate adenosyltransferase